MNKKIIKNKFNNEIKNYNVDYFKKNNILINKNIIFIFSITMFFFLTMISVNASLVLDSVQFDPTIIASGDEVDIIIQFYEKGIVDDSEVKIGNPDYKFNVNLQPDDTLTENYVTIIDKEGDDIHGSILAGEYYTKKFRVKVNQDAPAGSYQFKLIGKWYKDGKSIDSGISTKFIMEVKKEGIILDVSTITTTPAEVRPGDNYVKLVSNIENVGEKDAKSVEINLNLPDGLESSYTNGNRVWVGRVNSGESKEVTFFVDVNEDAKAEDLSITYNFDYMDLDNNHYSNSRTIPFLVKPRPYLEVITYEGDGLAGQSSKLYITLKNTGSESAEAVDVRILKQNSQPFTIDVRSDYIGELEPGEEGVAVFDIKANTDAEFRDYDFKLLIRSKGDSDEGDDNIYTYNRRAKFTVTGKATNKLLLSGLIGASFIIIFYIVSKIYTHKTKKRHTK